MATSRLEIFKTELTPQRNAQIDDINSYLTEQCEKIYDNSNYQYQRIILDTTMKITAAQEDFNGMPIGNYIRLTQDGKQYYYFIMDSEWTSVNSCKLICSIDSVNTFVNELEWSDKTSVSREHDNRYTKENRVVNEQYGYFARRMQGGQTLRYQIQSDELKNTTIVDIVDKVIPSSGTIITTTVKQNSFDSVNGILNLSVTFIVGGNLGDSSSGIIQFTVNCTGGIKRKIDMTPESIEPTLYGRNVGDVLDKDGTDSWYLIYNSKPITEGQAIKGIEPVETYLCKDSDIKVALSKQDTNTKTFNASDLEEAQYYFIDPFNGKAKLKGNKIDGYYWDSKIENISQEIKSSNELLMTTKFINESSSGQLGIYKNSTISTCILYRSGNNIVVNQVDFAATQQSLRIELNTTIKQIATIPSVTISSNGKFKVFKSSSKPIKVDNVDQYYMYANSQTIPISVDRVIVDIYNIDYFNKAQSTLIKIIKLPYCPLNYTIDNDGVYNFEYNLIKVDKSKNDFNIDLMLIPQSVVFKCKLDTNAENPLKPVFENVEINPNKYDLKDIKYETKLYNSEFYDPKFVYDSFEFDFDLEKVNNSEQFNENLVVEYKPTKTFGSAMLFTFTDYKTKGLDTANYNNIMAVNRNNEIPIYNSEYLNYIKNGYNYDVKNRNTNVIKNVVGGVIRLGTGLAAGADVKPTFTRNEVEKAMKRYTPKSKEFVGPMGTHQGVAIRYMNGSIGTSISISRAAATAGIGLAASSVSDAVFGYIQSERDLEQKKALLSQQKTGISSCDSIDLLEEYSHNKAKMMVYEPTQRIKDLLFNLFYYTGYSRNIQKLPNLNNRYWFNYIQCEPVFKGKNAATYNVFIDDIKERFSNGVTIYHCHKNNVGKREWDLDQQYENWETNLIS